jgi:hypothetical protein
MALILVCVGLGRRVDTPGMGEHGTEPGSVTEPESDSQRFNRLPERIRLEDTVESQATDTARDPEGGRDTERDFMIRYSGA